MLALSSLLACISCGFICDRVLVCVTPACRREASDTCTASHTDSRVGNACRRHSAAQQAQHTAAWQTLTERSLLFAGCRIHRFNQSTQPPSTLLARNTQAQRQTVWQRRRGPRSSAHGQPHPSWQCCWGHLRINLVCNPHQTPRALRSPHFVLTSPENRTARAGTARHEQANRNERIQSKNWVNAPRGTRREADSRRRRWRQRAENSGDKCTQATQSPQSASSTLTHTQHTLLPSQLAQPRFRLQANSTPFTKKAAKVRSALLGR